jgi:hypothetical protein
VWSTSLQAVPCDPVVTRPANLRSWVRPPLVLPIVGAATPVPLRVSWSKVGMRPPPSPAAMVPRVDVGVCSPRPPPSRCGGPGGMSSFMAGRGLRSAPSWPEQLPPRSGFHGTPGSRLPGALGQSWAGVPPPTTWAPGNHVPRNHHKRFIIYSS